MIMDYQSVKRAEGGEAIGFGGNRRVHGRKRVLLTDTLSFARLVKGMSADQHDSQFASNCFTACINGLVCRRVYARFLQIAAFAVI